MTEELKSYYLDSKMRMLHNLLFENVKAISKINSYVVMSSHIIFLLLTRIKITMQANGIWYSFIHLFIQLFVEHLLSGNHVVCKHLQYEQRQIRLPPSWIL